MGWQLVLLSGAPGANNQHPWERELSVELYYDSAELCDGGHI
jgi:hypothetical protein